MAEFEAETMLGMGRHALLSKLVDRDIERDGPIGSFMVRSGLLRQILDERAELLEALERLVELDSDGEAGCRVDPIEYGEALNAGRAAIAKARGAA